ncbi:peptidase inhibitor family I36 protein [Kitasatospora sp. NPDC056651]|uniref:peptidase inhibitor family I36 protein n=1 Tax=Kitasatospora sp. NPDC056651 TaxID=3345892 RepID=UPI0036975D00
MTERGIRKSVAAGKAVVAVVTAVLAILATTGVAGAAAGAAAGPGRAGAGPDFSAQARSAGLNGSQAAELQSRVDGYLATMGGTQVAANKISLDGGALLVPLPGEARARDLAAPGDVRGLAATCPYTYVCAYQLPNFTGATLTFFTCDKLNPIPWGGTGSWINNQRSGLHAKFYDVNGNLGWTSPGGYSEDPAAPWGWVYWLSPC